MKSPYSGLPNRQFWKLAVEGQDVHTIQGIYTKRFSINGMRIATAGSCFAQEIAKALRKRGYAVVDTEPAPSTNTIRGKLENSYGYGLYSARHGNIYTARQLLQLMKEAFGYISPDPDQFIWEKDGRFYDALRPGVEPNGLPTAEEVVLQRKDHLRRVRRVIGESDLFVFTFGLTECWTHKASGLVYPTAPGVIAGHYDPSIYEFRNFTFKEIYDDFMEFRALAQMHKPNLKFLLTVSPVPLTASSVDAHVLVSTVRSKSMLRAVVAQLYEELPEVDYFPSYELFSTPFLGAHMFKENRRSVRPDGVAAVMKVFFGEHNDTGAPPVVQPKKVAAETNGDAVCEEALLEAFAGEKK